MDKLNHASLFTGIGGFDLAAQWAGWNNIFQVEIDEFCQKVLTKNFPNVKKYRDIKKFNATEYRGTVDVISGGFPCQPFSNAGDRKGTEDERDLWPEMFRIIREVGPSYVVGENVGGLLSMDNGAVLKRILADLESEGYKWEIFNIPAAAVQAWHKRERVWIVGHTNSNGLEAVPNDKVLYREPYKAADLSYRSLLSMSVQNGEVQGGTEGCGDVDGIPNRVDRLKSLGNAIVPQVAYEIFNAINNTLT